MTGEPMREYDTNAPNYFVIATDISDRKKVEEERLADKIEQQKEVSRIILKTQEMQRNELGRELHDNINQILASVSLRLAYYMEEPEGNLDIVENCRRDLNKAIQETRNLAHHMVMPTFPEMNLRQELELLIGTYDYGQVIMLRFNIANEEEISSDIKETLFRIAQEHLSNITKHARASKIELELDVISRKISMTIHDNGIGFDIKQKRAGIGITNIFNRVESYNGHVDISSLPGQGCTLSLSIPLVS
jgi:two-component system sensor histidine kinase UhpB